MAGSILIVDDDSESLALLSSILTEEGYRVRAADSGQLALASIESEAPDLILLDMRMPGMDGLELLQRLKAHRNTSDVPAMFISGSSGSESRIRGLQLGAVDFVTKPYQRDELSARVRTHIELARLRFHLEDQVTKRTEQLSATVELLRREIEDRKRTERALRESEVRFRTMADTAPVMIATSDIHQQATFFNKAWLDLTGRTIEHELGMGWIDSIHPEDVPACLAEVSRSFTAQSLFNLEFRLRRFDGKYGNVMCKGVPRYEADGTFVGFIACIVDITELQQNQAKLRALSASLISVQDEERRRISRELHDDLIQRLAMLAIDLGKLMENNISGRGIDSDLHALQKRAVETAELTRHIAHELHPLILDDLGIVAALRSLCDEYARREEIQIDFISSDLPNTLPRETASCIYAVAQEALLNISKHAQAQRVQANLVGTSNSVVLRIVDDGVGVALSVLEGAVGLGVMNMRERVRWVRGSFSLTSLPQRGALLTIEIPIIGDDVETSANHSG